MPVEQWIQFVSLLRIKAGLNLRALRSLFSEQSFHAIGQKKNEAILLAWSYVMSARLEKKLKYIQLFFQKRMT